MENVDPEVLCYVPLRGLGVVDLAGERLRCVATVRQFQCVADRFLRKMVSPTMKMKFRNAAGQLMRHAHLRLLGSPRIVNPCTVGFGRGDRNVRRTHREASER